MRNPIIVPLDFDDPKKAQDVFKKISGHVGGFKIGPRLTLRMDKSFLKDLKQAGTLFFDHKFFDIPSTTLASVQVAAELGADWVTVHALNGGECLRQLAQLEKSIQKTHKDFKLAVVTVLTSFDQKDLAPVWQKISIETSVKGLAQLATESGLSTFVCSPLEIKAIKEVNPQSFVITPGVRLENLNDDQKRIATPRQAMDNGASALVIGRPIIEAPHPLSVVEEILKTL